MKKQFFGVLAATSVFGLAIIPAACAQDAEPQAGTKYLVIAEQKDNFFSLPADKRMELTKASNMHVAEAVKAGNILEFYQVPGRKKVVVIEQRDSIEDLYKHFEEEPMYPYAEFQVYPLAEREMEGDLAAKAISDPKKLKFLVVVQAKDVYYTLPAGEREKLESRAAPFQPGDLVKSYSIPGWNRIVSFEQYDSIESLYKHFEADPYYPYGNFEVYPLYQVDFSEEKTE